MKKFKKYIYIILVVLIMVGCSSTPVDKNQKISRHFTMGDAVRSSAAKKYRIKNIPNSGERRNIIYTAKRLEEVRKILKRDLQITSWYRSSKLNRKIGGSPTSAHKSGLAVDFMLKRGKAGKREFQLIKRKLKSFDQLVYYPRRGHLHVGFRKNKKKERHQVMIK